ncbi:MAG: hypothetical protein ACFFDN_33370 [Candidatus Hodarchaeota archaeon]
MTIRRKVIMKKIKISDVLGKRLAGATKAQNDFPKLILELIKAQKGEIFVLDFSGVESITASYWNNIIQPLLNFTADAERDLFPIFCNIVDEPLEELKLTLDHRRIAILVSTEKNGILRNLELIGSIDNAHVETFNLVNTLGEVGASDIISQVKFELNEGMPSSSGWNNRLATLYQMRLIRRTKKGRSYKYKPIVEEKNG